MTIASILRGKGAEVVTVGAEQGLQEVARLLTRRRIGAVLVSGGDGPPLGILSERDIVRLFAEDDCAIESQTAADAMTRIQHTVTPATSVLEALALMTDRRVRHLPVVEDGAGEGGPGEGGPEKGRVVGIVSIGDLVKARIEAADGEAQALRDYVTTG